MGGSAPEPAVGDQIARVKRFTRTRTPTLPAHVIRRD